MKTFILLLSLLLFNLSLNSGAFIFDEHKQSLTIKEFTEWKEKEQKQREFIERQNLTILIISKIESSFNPFAYNQSEEAVGLLQIRPIMVREVNRLLGFDVYSLSDRYSIDKSIEMFISYQNIVNPEWCYERSARLWNGGITGMRKSSTDVYWNKFITYLDGAYN
jgi:hypothetical protein